MGAEDEEALARFEDHYLGEYPSLDAYAEYLLEECGAYQVTDEAPEWLQSYLKVDVEGYANDLGIGLHVVEGEDGNVHVFDTRC